MADMNQIFLLGRLGNDPVQRETKNGTKVVHFSMATSRPVTRDGETKPETQWHKVVVWGKQGEACANHLKKGHQALVVGEFRSRPYDDKDGNPRTQYEVHAERVTFLNAKPNSKADSVWQRSMAKADSVGQRSIMTEEARAS